jgi:hypothetical protein
MTRPLNEPFLRLDVPQYYKLCGEVVDNEDSRLESENRALRQRIPSPRMVRTFLVPHWLGGIQTDALSTQASASARHG